MNIQSVASTAPTTIPGALPEPAKVTSDFETFLKMLTVQLQNQDPMNPIDSADYAVQLATFSGVEQQVRTNQLLEALGGQFSMMGMAQLAGWVGQEARSTGPVWMDGDPVTLSPSPAAGADAAVLVVRDQQGRLVSREAMPPTAEPYEWLGADIAGNPLPQGRYTLSMESYRGEELLRTNPVEAYGRIVEAQRSPTGTMLVLEGGIQVDASAVTALRDG